MKGEEYRDKRVYAQDAEDEAMVCDAISKDVVFDALLRLYDLPYTSTHA